MAANTTKIFVEFMGRLVGLADLAREKRMPHDLVYNRWVQMNRPFRVTEEIAGCLFSPIQLSKSSNKPKILITVVDGNRTTPMSFPEMPEYFRTMKKLDKPDHYFRKRWIKAGCPNPAPARIFTEQIKPGPTKGSRSAARVFCSPR